MAIESGTGPGNVSGVVVLDQLNLAKELLGEDVVARAVAHLAPDAHAELDALLPMSWCKLTTAFAIHEAIANEIGQGVKEWHRTIVRAGIERTLNTVWRFFIRLTSIEAIVKRATTIYGKSFDRGSMRAALVSDDVIEVVLTEWNDVPDFELDAIASGLDAVLSVAKKKHSRITFERRLGGARFEVRLR
jgi:hypothetical protein